MPWQTRTWGPSSAVCAARGHSTGPLACADGDQAEVDAAIGQDVEDPPASPPGGVPAQIVLLRLARSAPGGLPAACPETSSNPGPRKNTTPGSSGGAELPVDGQAQGVAVEAAAAVQVAGPKQDPAAQNVHATLSARRVTRRSRRTRTCPPGVRGGLELWPPRLLRPGARPACLGPPGGRVRAPRRWRSSGLALVTGGPGGWCGWRRN